MNLNKMLVVMISIVILALISACDKDGTSSIDLKNKPRVTHIGSNNSSLKQTAAEEGPERKDGKIGEKVSLNGQEFTVRKLEISNGNEKDKPNPGRYFAIVTVQIKNTGKDSLPYKYSFFDALNNKGQTQWVAISQVDIDTAILDGELKPGESVTGTLAFELPKRDSLAKLRYYPPTGDSANISLE